jgi:hypothetical protein
MLCFMPMQLEDNLITIEGLTKRQKKLLQIIWSIDSKEHLFMWVKTLSQSDREMVSSLMTLISMEVMEDFIDEEYTEANEIISKFKLSEI